MGYDDFIFLGLDENSHIRRGFWLPSHGDNLGDTWRWARAPPHPPGMRDTPP